MPPSRDELQFEEDAVGRVRFRVFAKPRAAKSRIVGVRAGALELALAAPPVEGAANEELVAFLSRCLDLPKRDVELLRGQTGRHKLVAVTGLTGSEIHARLMGLAGR